MWIANNNTKRVHDEDCQFAKGIETTEYDDLTWALKDGFSEAGCCLTDTPYEPLIQKRHDNREALNGKGCAVCGENRCIERAHIVPASLGGIETIGLCPLHHRAFDRGVLKKRELNQLRLQAGARLGNKYEQLVIENHGRLVKRAAENRGEQND